jgi:cell division protein FtsW
VTQAVAQARPQRAPVSTRIRPWGFDPWLLLLLVSMIAFGLVMVYSASWDVSWRLYQDPNALFRRQLGNLFIGLAALGIAATFPIQWLKKLALPILALSIVALILVVLVNVGGGVRRSFLAGSVQPSEMAKLAMIIYLAVWMPLMVIIGVIDFLILMEPDLSAVLTVAMVGFLMFYLAGAHLSQSLFITLGGAGVGYMLIRLTNTGRERWADYMAGLVNVEEASYHVQHSLQAFYAGGLIGRGLGASREKFGLLPAPHTDSIYAVIGEELGLVGAMFVLSLFFLLMYRGFRVALESPDRLSMLVAGGVTFWIGVEALVNMSVLLGLLPFAGNALPFFSYGGSSLVTTLAAAGLLLNVSRRKPLENAPSDIVSSVGVGWRYRRGRVSRLSHRRRDRQEG